MHELIPIVIGIVIGLGVYQIRSTRIRTAALVVLCLLGGALASFINGELALSLAFVSFDALLVWAGALASTLLLALWRRRSALR
ncbi:MAG TPA: hypothetical protein VFZ66_13270 [Herpetosiphonaceae bacterium]